MFLLRISNYWKRTFHPGSYHEPSSGQLTDMPCAHGVLRRPGFERVFEVSGEVDKLFGIHIQLLQNTRLFLWMSMITVLPKTIRQDITVLKKYVSLKIN
jgi:hypothetical protein